MSTPSRFLAFATAILALFLAACSSSSSPSPASDAPPAQAGETSRSLSVLSAACDGSLHWRGFSSGNGGVLAVRSDGSLWGWGRMPLDTPFTKSSHPARIGRDSDWARPASGWGLAFTAGAIKSDNTLWTWGTNFLGMLGRPVPEEQYWRPDAGDEERSYYPEYPPTPLEGHDWAGASFGANHVLAVKIDGTLWGWGSRTQGRLGDNVWLSGEPWDFATCVQQTPMRIGADRDWVDAQAGGPISVARKSDGTLWQWGFGGILTPTRVGTADDRWSAYAVGYDHVLAIRRDDGSLWAWGSNGHGQLGTGTTLDSVGPVRISTGPWKAVGAGAYHSLAVRADGTLWTFGKNHAGKLGTGGQLDSRIPVQVGAADDWVSVGGGDDFSVALKEKNPDGKLWLWGANDAGQLGNGFTSSTGTPTLVSPARGWGRVDPGAFTTFGIRPDGTLWGWGSNADGQLGDATGADRQLPGQVGPDADWKAAAAGNAHTLALKNDGSLWSWGYNYSGELGIGTLDSRPVPGRIGTDLFRAVFAGDQASFAIRSDGTLWAWGLDVYNRLGIGNAFTGLDSVSPAMYVTSPRQVGADNGWKQLSASATQTMAIREDGSLWSWGTGAFGALGNGLDGTGVPVRVGHDADWDQVATSGYHAMALKRDGSLWGWGMNSSGQLGTGTFAGSGSPVRIGSELWRTVAVRYTKTAAVRQDGTLWEWGAVMQPAPEAPMTGSPFPVRIGSGAQWQSVFSNPDGTHWAALQVDGSLYTWGDNWCGQLGNQAAWTPEPVWIP